LWLLGDVWVGVLPAVLSVALTSGLFVLVGWAFSILGLLFDDILRLSLGSACCCILETRLGCCSECCKDIQTSTETIYSTFVLEIQWKRRVEPLCSLKEGTRAFTAQWGFVTRLHSDAHQDCSIPHEENSAAFRRCHESLAQLVTGSEWCQQDCQLDQRNVEPSTSSS
jgi:hypothetical protein